jgi:hypothetical protein
MIIPANTIRSRIDASFNGFQNKFDPVLLYQALADLCSLAAQVPQIPGITALVGDSDDSLEYMPVEGLPIGTTVVVRFNSSLMVYVLSEQHTPTLAPYVIRSHFSTTQQPRSWVRSGVQCHEFTMADLSGEFQLTLAHNLGFPLCSVMVFNATGALLSGIPYTPDPEDPNNQLLVQLGSGFEGTWRVLVIY